MNSSGSTCKLFSCRFATPSCELGVFVQFSYMKVKNNKEHVQNLLQARPWARCFIVNLTGKPRLRVASNNEATTCREPAVC